jgi:hypothetical protein
VDPTVVTVGQTLRFPGAVVTAIRGGPDDGDDRADDTVLGHSGDGQVAWTQQW